MTAFTLSPYDPGTDAAVVDALRALLDVPTTVPLTWRDLSPQDDPSLRLQVTVGDTADALRLRLSAPRSTPATWQGRTLRLEVMAGQGDDRTVTAALSRRLAGLERAGDPMRTLGAALTTHRATAVVPPGEFATIGPRELLLRLTFRCNQDCSFCWQDRTWPAPPRSQLERWLHEAHGQGVPTVLLSGGEPTLSPDLLPLLDTARTLGLRTGLQTNAIQLAKPHVLAALRQAGLGFVLVSYHSHDPVLSDAMTRAPGTHVRTERGIVAALRAGVPVSLNLVLERRNLAGLAQTAAHIADHLAPHAPAETPLSLSISHPNAYFDREQWEETMAPLDEVEPVLRAAVTQLLAAGVAVDAAGPCGFPLCALRGVPHILPRGGRAQIAEANLSARADAAACRSCALLGACIGPRTTYLDRFGERGLVPFADDPLAAERTDPTVSGGRKNIEFVD